MFSNNLRCAQVAKVRPLVPEISFYVGQDGKVGRQAKREERVPCSSIENVRDVPVFTAEEER